MKEQIKKHRFCAPLLSVALVGACVSGSLSGYEPPVYMAAPLEDTEKDVDQNEKDRDVKDGHAKEDERADSIDVQGRFDLEDGVYTGVGTGYAGEISVSVEIRDHRIKGIEILHSPDDAAFFNRAVSVIDRILSEQSLEVDTVSGATYSSRGILSAVKHALTGERDSGVSAQNGSGAYGNAGGASVLRGAADVTPVEEAEGYRDGTYYGTAAGFAGNLRVRVDISGGQIASIEIAETVDDSAYVERASAVIEKMLYGQTTNVDTVSGATYSSAGIIRAVRDAMQQAEIQSGNGSSQENSGQSGSSQGENTQTSNHGGESGSGQPQGSSGGQNGGCQGIVGTVPYKEGIYYGTAEGYNEDITVAVVIQDETIKAILVTEQEDDEVFFNRAMAVVESVLRQQSADVDTVSGATYSSRGLLGAIRDALAHAEQATHSGGSANGNAPGGTGSGTGTSEGSANGNEPEGNGSGTGTGGGTGSETGTGGGTESGTGTSGETGSGTGIGGGAVDGNAPGGNGSGSGTGEGNANGNGTADENGEKLDIYHDGTYFGQALCAPDEDEEFEPYILSLRLTIKNNRITEVIDIKGDGASSNDRYISRAANGTKKLSGIVEQIIEKGNLKDIDTVSRATCSSKSILDACTAALENARVVGEEKE